MGGAFVVKNVQVQKEGEVKKLVAARQRIYPVARRRESGGETNHMK